VDDACAASAPGIAIAVPRVPPLVIAGPAVCGGSSVGASWCALDMSSASGALDVMQPGAASPGCRRDAAMARIAPSARPGLLIAGTPPVHRRCTTGTLQVRAAAVPVVRCPRRAPVAFAHDAKVDRCRATE
jgi:hypothetical protein